MMTAIVTCFAVDAGALVSALFLPNAPRVQQARTSFRPAPAVDREISWRKDDLDHQRDCAQQVVRFAPGTTWLCFSDQVMHAAVSGQSMLEQTIHLPVRALYDPQRAPLAILERLTGRPLIPAADRHP